MKNIYSFIVERLKLNSDSKVKKNKYDILNQKIDSFSQLIDICKEYFDTTDHGKLMISQLVSSSGKNVHLSSNHYFNFWEDDTHKKLSCQLRIGFCCYKKSNQYFFQTIQFHSNGAPILNNIQGIKNKFMENDNLLDWLNKMKKETDKNKRDDKLLELFNIN